MKTLRMLHNLVEGKDLSELPYDVFNDIKNSIRKGAADLEQQWKSALHLCNKAYQVEGVERPDPSMKSGWKQYSIALEYAVQQLAKYRGLDGDWRISAIMVNEAMERKIKYSVSSEGQTSGETYTVSAKSLDHVIDSITANNHDLVDIDIKKSTDGTSATLYFSKWGIKRNHRIVIEPFTKR